MFGRSSNTSSTSTKAPTLEQQIDRATDETLTADNWQYILEVCDKISQDPETTTKQAIKFVSARLALKDANVNLRSLSLLVAIAENCGSRMKQEIASASFINESLMKKLSDRKVHVTVKHKVAECIKQLYDSFRGDPSLKPMSDAYDKVVKIFPQYLSGSGGGRAAPSKPAKKEISQSEKAKEDEELQRVLKESLQEYEAEQKVKNEPVNRNKPLPVVATNEIEQQKTGEQTIATITKVRALYDLISYEPDELSFRKNDIITVLESVYRDWWKGSLPNGKVGIFPLNYVTPVVTKSPRELAKEQQFEQKILAVDSKKVDKLLALLSTNNPDQINEDEITRLYNEIVPIRPSVGKFIDKYSIRKEELFQLNSQLNAEAKLYNELMDTSISQRANRQQFSGPGGAPGSQNLPPYPTGPSGPANFPPQFSSQPQPQRQQQMQGQPQVQAQTQLQGQQQLSSQPTSSGFGNGRSESANGNGQPAFFQGQYQQYPVQQQAYQQSPEQQHQQQQHQQQQHYQQPQHHQQQQQQHNIPNRQSTQNFSNINQFPDVQNI
ncbi:class E vacuolar protein-sorting machinery protein Hse1p [[Candida] railenensis]|uniref:Class E vacuolar protein-sorting machinery protein HSE1 n=1 Tax=[Candida] railenensis TaxID=45579 RepID=A0A9P0VV74_9ASCO|nr:class E vacuolar protein-sorting machinery protein Hse1p [[Candida] railenensis]